MHIQSTAPSDQANSPDGDRLDGPAGAQADPLGSTTKYRDNLSGLGKGRKWRYRLLDAVSRLMPNSRVAGCMRYLAHGEHLVRIVKESAHGVCHYAGVATCGSVWSCPVCSVKIGEHRRKELEAGVQHWRTCGGRVVFGTLTFSHGSGDDLQDITTKMLDAWTKARQSAKFRAFKKRWGVRGSVRALEATWGRENGWHPHIHVLWFLRDLWEDAEEIDERSQRRMEDELYAIWRKALENVGLTCDREHGVDVRAAGDEVEAYVAKWGHDPSRRPWGASDELTKANTKQGSEGKKQGTHYTPWELLRIHCETGEALPGRLFVEFAEAMHGRRQLVWSDGTRGLLELGVELDNREVAAAEPEESELVYALTANEWYTVVYAGRQADLLEVAERFGREGVVRYVSSLLDEYGGRRL